MPPQQHSFLHESDVESYRCTSPILKKRFRFSLSSNEVFPIPHIDDLSDEEVKETWYEKQDYENIKMSIIPVVRKMMKGEKIEENDRQTIRGLEYRTRKGAIRRQHNKVEAITAVLDEQDLQIETKGYVDDERLAKVYIQFNAHCQEEAHKLALGDVEPAREHTADATLQHVRIYQMDEANRKNLDQSSLGKLFKQMRIRRRQSINHGEQNVLHTRGIAGIAA